MKAMTTPVAPAHGDDHANKDFRRYQSEAHMNRRLKEDRNEHYSDLSCPC
jgi:hypothetical protein